MKIHPIRRWLPRSSTAAQCTPGHALRFLVPFLCALFLAAHVSADQVQMQNGDRYVGKVLALNDKTLTLRSQVLGTVQLPRSQVSVIALGDGAAALPAPAPAPALAPKSQLPAATNSPDLAAALRALSPNSLAAEQVRRQFLAGAGGAANAKYDELLTGLANGTISINDLRAQARSAADQLRAARKDLGNDAGFALDGYLTILDSFLSETDPAKK
jgi:hypothetical protein